jgi:hypothetical protein
VTRRAVRRAATAATAAARKAAQTDPTARGADWRSATVATISSDGTITTTDGVIARRMEWYTTPTVGDLVHISRSGAGNWRAEGRAAIGAGVWTPIPMAANWNTQNGYYTPAYRRTSADTASLRGLAGNSQVTLTNGTVIATLPTEVRPAFKVRATVQVATGYFGVMTISADGTIALNDFSSGMPTTGTKWAEFDVFSNYSLA